jgi:arylsulfatase A-like enzyme
MSKPNIILILADDLGAWGLGCAGNREILTPSIDRLAREGIVFDNFFCTSPVCSPARASIMTGRIPSQHGVHDWLRGGNSPLEEESGGKVIENLRDQPGFTDALAANGYTCGISGKWHLGNSLSKQMSFSFWDVHAKGAGPYYGAPMVKDGEIYTEPSYITDGITEKALAFLETAGDDPFFLSLNYTAPHNPWEREHHPPRLFDGYYNGCPFESVPDEPSHPWQTSVFTPRGDREKRREILSGYFAAVTGMDENIGRVLRWLEERGKRNNTLIFFTSDNGMNMGHHGIWGKGNGTFPLNMFDTSVKVPAVISCPSRIAGGGVCHELMSHYDFMPTLLDYLELENPWAEKLPGTSFASLLQGRAQGGRGNGTGGRDQIVVYDEYGPVRMIRTRDWKYVHRYPYGPHELYHLAEDPEERENLYSKRDRRISELRSRLEQWFFRYADPRIDGTKEAVTGRGQLGLAGLWGSGAASYAGDWAYLKDKGQEPRSTYSPYSEVPKGRPNL